MKSFLKASLWIGGVLVLLIAGLYWREDRRGVETWAETRNYLEAEGEPLRFSELIPPLPPDEENFCAHPLVASLVDFEKRKDGGIVYRDPDEHDRIAAMKLPTRLPTRERRNPSWWADYRTGDLPDFEWWAELFREESEFEVSDPTKPAPVQILSALERFDSEFAEFEAAARRPKAVFAIDWPGEGEAFKFMAMPHPHSTDIHEISKVLNLRGLAALAAGQPEIARESIDIMFRLADSLEQEPELVGNMVALTARSIALSVIWYGLRERIWLEEDLFWLESRLDFLANFDAAINAFRGEMLVNQVFFNDSVKDLGFKGTGYYAALPDGYWDWAKSEGCRYLYDGIIRPLKDGDHLALVSLGGVPLPEPKVYNKATQWMLPAIDLHGRNLVRIKTLGLLAMAACSLERYFQKTGDYPDSTWDPLVPEFLSIPPLDLLDGKPIRYLRTDDGRYRLYSIGSNLIDDGGRVVFPNTRTPDYNSGDWVWAYSFPERENR